MYHEFESFDPHQSFACKSQRTGKPLKKYLSKNEAQTQAKHIRLTHGTDQVPYECEQCGGWHLCPRERYTPSKYCAACGKQLYETEAYASRRAQIRGGGLRVYACPCGGGWHLTCSVANLSNLE